MNFLAHIYLSGDDSEIVVGNVIGDFVKGSQIKNYPSKIKKGILLHREIDHFTDTHPVVRESKMRLRLKYRHYASVISDVYYDHFLAVKWSAYSNEELEDYTVNFYQMMMEFDKMLPLGVRQMLEYMKRDNWLLNYQKIEGIDQALTGMSKRTKFESKMETAAKELQINFSKYEDEFLRFFPDLQDHCKKFLSK